jgi:hypothetical protein
VHAAQTYPTAHARIRIRHDDRTTFVAGSDELGPGRNERVCHRKISAADDAKCASYAESGEELTQDFGN